MHIRTAVGVVAFVGIAAGLTTLRARPAPPADTVDAPSTASRVPVVAELFTSEGCSSCPAADDLLREWLATQPVPGVEIVALSEHVDYWDRLGWKDPFSSHAFSARQSAYDAAVFRSQRVYTPQLVIDGRYEAIGSDAAAVRRTLIEAARQPKAALDVSPTVAGRSARVRVAVMVPPTVARQGIADVVLALAEDGLSTTVARGENGGRTLRHAAVVRALHTAGAIDGASPTATVVGDVPLPADWSHRRLRLVAFLQERDSRRILGTIAADLIHLTDRK